MDGVVLVAAGSSRRFGGKVSKVLRRLAGKPVIVRAIGPFLVALDRFALVVVARKTDFAALQRLLPRAKLVEGGETRAESVKAGVLAFPEKVETVLVHDAARPLVSAEVVRRVLSAARKHGAAVPVVGVRDSLHRIQGATKTSPALVTETPRRADLAAAQTPQAAQRTLLLKAIAAAGDDLPKATDEVALLKAAGIPVAAVKGDRRNFKITSTQDLALAEIVLNRK